MLFIKLYSIHVKKEPGGRLLNVNGVYIMVTLFEYVYKHNLKTYFRFCFKQKFCIKYYSIGNFDIKLSFRCHYDTIPF